MMTYFSFRWPAKARLLGLSLLLLVAPASLWAARVDTLDVPSPSMGIEVRAVVVVPDGASQEHRFPTLYLLHGHGGHHLTWLGIRPDLGELAERYGMIIVCPDGRNSWYWDSPRQPQMRYETFISEELPSYIDGHYPTIAQASGRAITGLSMGGHGALWNALRHPDVFGAAGSMSGGVDLRPFPKNWNVAALLGEASQYPEEWAERRISVQAERVDRAVMPRLMIDCGVKDFFLDVNRELHLRLMELEIPHDFILRPGAHDGPYWYNALPYQLLFFQRFFLG